MDFGEILNQWENRPPDQPEKDKKPQPEVNPMETWIHKYGVYDKDEENENTRPNAESAERRRRLRAKKPDAQLDIHGLTRDEAWEALERFFASAKEQEFEKVLVIHGKGNHSPGEAVLKRVVREFIEHCPSAGESRQGSPAGQGGSGATWVILKQNTSVPGK